MRRGLEGYPFEQLGAFRLGHGLDLRALCAEKSIERGAHMGITPARRTELSLLITVEQSTTGTVDAPYKHHAGKLLGHSHTLREM